MSLPGRTMSEEFLRALEVDCDRDWECALRQLDGSILQSWLWGEFKSRHGWSATRLLLAGPDGPAAAAQVLFRSIGPLTVAYVPRGPAVDSRVPGANAALTVALDRLCRSKRSVELFIEPDRDLSPLPQVGSLAWTLTDTLLQPRRTIRLRIDRDDEELLGMMKSKTRYNVRLAQRRGVTARRGTMEDLPAFYRLLCETGARDEFGIHSVEYYRDMLGMFGADSTLIVAEQGQELAAGVLILRHRDEAVYMFGASSSAHQRDMPAYLVQLEAMRWARSRGCRWYDLWGIPPTDDPPAATGSTGGQLNVRSGLWGVYRFKQGFGGDVVSYPGVYERVYMQPLVSLWRRFGPGIG